MPYSHNRSMSTKYISPQPLTQGPSAEEFYLFMLPACGGPYAAASVASPFSARYPRLSINKPFATFTECREHACGVGGFAGIEGVLGTFLAVRSAKWIISVHKDGITENGRGEEGAVAAVTRSRPQKSDRVGEFDELEVFKIGTARQQVYKLLQRGAESKVAPHQTQPAEGSVERGV